MFLSYLLVFILAAIPLFELVAVIPLAVIGGLSPWLTAVLAFLGNALTVILLVIFVDHVKRWMRRRKQKRTQETQEENEGDEGTEESLGDSKKGKRARVLFDKYGLPGLTIIGPFFVGSHISAFMAMSFGSERQMVVLWMIISLLLWAGIVTVVASSGATYFNPNVEEDGFLIQLFDAK